MLDPQNPPGVAPAASATPSADPSPRPLRQWLKAAVVLVFVGLALTAFASWYWTGSWTWMFHPR